MKLGVDSPAQCIETSLIRHSKTVDMLRYLDTIAVGTAASGEQHHVQSRANAFAGHIIAW
jgi:hypothetical protein